MNNPKIQLTHNQNYVEAVDQENTPIATDGLTALCNAQEKSLNEIELKAISGMIAYIAYFQKVDESIVIAVLTAMSGIEEVGSLPSDRYGEIMDFLINLQIAKIVN